MTQLFRKKFNWLFALAIAALVVVPFAAFADNTVPDGDGVEPVTGTALSFGTVCAGSTTTKTALIAINRNGNATNPNTFKNGSTVTISVLSTTGTGLSAAQPNPNTIALPANWGSLPQNTDSASVSSDVTFVAGGAGPFSGSVLYRSSGVNSSDTTINRDGTLNVTATVEDCTPADTTPPTVTATPDRGPDSNGWYNQPVTFTFTANEPATCDAPKTYSGPDADPATVTGDCTDTAGNVGTGSITFKYDATAPTGVSGAPNRTPDHNDWYNDAVDVVFTGSDATSGIASCSTVNYNGPDGSGLTVNGDCTDNAGNASAAVASSAFNYDATAPTNIVISGVSDYYFGDTPGTASCTAEDATSGVDSCNVSGYGATGVGTHTATATATDNAGNTSEASASYKVLAWTLTGFYAPVDMNGVYNVVKGGSTVPLKFEVFAGSTEKTDTSVVKSFTQAKIACDASAAEDAVEVTTTGGTSLRYDATAGQFVQNWKTPTGAGTCYRVTMTTLDGSSLIALFKLK